MQSMTDKMLTSCCYRVSSTRSGLVSNIGKSIERKIRSAIASNLQGGEEPRDSSLEVGDTHRRLFGPFDFAPKRLVPSALAKAALVIAMASAIAAVASAARRAGQ